jgi:chromate transporter
MIVAFVGFAGGYTKLVLGPDAPILAGAIAACLVTWFTFLPSFVFIFAGGPFIESTHENLDLTAPLTAITAAVVGVILNLAIVFGQHVLWPQGFGGGVDVVAAAIALGAATALFGFKRSVIQVVVGCAVAGLAIKAIASVGFGL